MSYLNYFSYALPFTVICKLGPMRRWKDLMSKEDYEVDVGY